MRDSRVDKMQNAQTGAQTKNEEKPDLDKLYKPVGIQAINAASCCKKTQSAGKSA